MRAFFSFFFFFLINRIPKTICCRTSPFPTPFIHVASGAWEVCEDHRGLLLPKSQTLVLGSRGGASAMDVALSLKTKAWLPLQRKHLIHEETCHTCSQWQLSVRIPARVYGSVWTATFSQEQHLCDTCDTSICRRADRPSLVSKREEPKE